MYRLLNQTIENYFESELLTTRLPAEFDLPSACFSVILYIDKKFMLTIATCKEGISI